MVLESVRQRGLEVFDNECLRRVLKYHRADVHPHTRQHPHVVCNEGAGSSAMSASIRPATQVDELKATPPSHCEDVVPYGSTGNWSWPPFILIIKQILSYQNWRSVANKKGLINWLLSTAFQSTAPHTAKLSCPQRLCAFGSRMPGVSTRRTVNDALVLVPSAEVSGYWWAITTGPPTARVRPASLPTPTAAVCFRRRRPLPVDAEKQRRALISELLPQLGNPTTMAVTERSSMPIGYDEVSQSLRSANSPQLEREADEVSCELGASLTILGDKCRRVGMLINKLIEKRLYQLEELSPNGRS